ncbi:MAG TPA: hypothetical protein VKZ61_07950 [Thermomicrobiales bacterium]|jgi:hypothetical protein|nr:hypothetical protein [Thermomicrobiales bacterium]
MHNDLNFETRIINYVRGTDDPELAQHIATCPECQASLDTIRMLDDTRQLTGPLPSIPDRLATTLESLLPRIRPDLVTPSAPSLIERARERVSAIVADLIFDSAATPEVAGLRGASGRTRQLAFVSDLADLDVELTPQDDDWLVTGQLGMDEVPEGLRIRFIPSGEDPLDATVPGARETGITGEGYFSLTLPSGGWTAAVTMDDATIVFQDIDI